jgi:hypothetical protein
MAKVLLGANNCIWPNPCGEGAHSLPLIWTRLNIYDTFNKPLQVVQSNYRPMYSKWVRHTKSLASIQAHPSLALFQSPDFS